MLITLEGIDGCGKSTLAPQLTKAIGEAYPNATIIQTKEPGSKFLARGAELRDLALNTIDLRPFERELLFYVDASLHKNFMERQEGSVIVSDRGLWSHLAYLRGYLKTAAMNYDTYGLCKQIISKVCAEPDCVVYFKGSLELMKNRLAGRAKDAIEENGDPFFSTVLETYEDLVVRREWEGQPIVTLDPTAPTSVNTMKVVDYLKEVFNEHTILRSGDKKVC